MFSPTGRRMRAANAASSTLHLQPIALAVLIVAGAAAPQFVLAQAEAARAPQQQALQRFDIPAGPLEGVLNRLGREAGVLIGFGSAVTEGLRSNGVSGSLTVQDALSRALAGTGLGAVRSAGGGYALNALPASNARPADEVGAATLAAVTVSAQAVRDAATEGSGSYGARGVTIGKTVQSLREIAQSVSVVTRQRMDDQNLTTVEEALKSATGVTAVSQGEGTAVFYSRGYTMNAQYDGVPAGRQIINGYKQLDTAVYDRIEVLRGPAGLMQGSGEPGGTVNLVRKGPLDQFQISGAVSAGSWHNDRSEVDITGPMNASGTLRGRAVLAAEDREFHYDTARNRQQLAYGTLDWDLMPDTTLSLTAASQHSKLTGRSAGLPTYADGSFLAVPRSTSIGADWQRWEYPVNEYAAELTQRFANDWKAKVSVRQRKTNFESAYLATTAAVDPATLTTDFSGRKTDWPVKNQDIDLNVSGPFELLGRRHELVFGFNRSKVDIQGSYAWSYFAGRDVFDPGTPSSALAEGKPSFAERETQSGIYGAARLKVTEPLTLILGGRMSRFLIDSRSISDSAWTDYSEARNEFTPYGGLVWDIDKRWSAYVSYADIFVPQGEKDYTGRRLKPRIGWQTEAGIKAELMENKLQASLAVFRVRDENRSAADPDVSHVCDTWNGACYVAAGLVQSQGVEAELNGKLAPNWNVSAGYTYNSTKYLKDGNAANVGQPLLTYVPKHIFKLWTHYAFQPRDVGGLLHGWSIGGGVTAHSKMYVSSGPATIRQGGYATVDMQVGYRFNKNLSATLSVNNLFDRNYYESLGTPAVGNYYGAPRHFMLTMRATY